MPNRYAPQAARSASPDRLAIKVRAAIGAMLAVGAIGSHLLVDSPPAMRSWSFGGSAELPGSYGLETPNLSAGQWGVEGDAAAANGRALVNKVGEAGQPAALALISGLAAEDAHLRTRCRGTCGVVFRVRDPQTYYVARIDAGTREVVLGVVDGGSHRDLTRAPLAHTSDDWSQLDVRIVGDRIVVKVDDRQVIDVRDDALRGPGAKGLWAPALESASFDVLTVSHGRATRRASIL